MHNFLGEAAQLVAGPSSGDKPVREVHQSVIDRLPLCKKKLKLVNLTKQGKLL